MKNNRPDNILLIVLIAVFAVLALYFAVLAVSALRAAPVLQQDALEAAKNQSIAFDYRVYTVPSLLYPEGTEPLTPGMAGYFANVTEKIEFTINGELSVDPAVEEPQGDLEVRLLVRSEGLWEKELAFVPPVTVLQPESGVVKFSSVFTLPLQEAEELAEAISEELGVHPRETSFVIACTLLSSFPQTDCFSPDELVAEYSFLLKGSVIEPQGELLFQEAENANKTPAQVNYMSFWGSALEIPRARALFLSLLLLFLAATGISLFYWHKKCHRSLADEWTLKLKRFNKRYASRIVKAGELEFPEGACKIGMESFKELLRIADERERPVLQVLPKNQEEKIVHYYVVDGEILYFYRMGDG